MEQLPVELLEKILGNKILSIQDVLNFSTTSKQFHGAVMCSSSIWRQKFIDCWPKFTIFFEKCFNNYFKEIQYIYKLKKRTFALLNTMSPRFYKNYQLSDADFHEWRQLLSEKPQTYHYLVRIFTDIINCHDQIKSIELVPLNTPGNKTLKYYASKVLRFIKQRHLTKVWLNYLNLPPKKQTLEKGATFVAQWCQTDLDITEEKIESELDFIAFLIRQHLAGINPKHKLLVASQTDLDRWKYENLDDNQWSVPECHQLLVVMREVMFSELRFMGNSENYYSPENSLINKVLERRTGLPIVLAVIYEGVGRRLGLLFQPINFPAHFLLRFIIGEQRHPTVYYIDTFNGGDVMQKTTCPYSSVSRDVLFPVATPIQVVERLVNNLELSTRQQVDPNGRVTFLRAVLELLILMGSQDLLAVVNLAKLYILHKVDTRSLERYLFSQTFSAPDQVKTILRMVRNLSKHNPKSAGLPERETTVIQRSKKLKYTIGMIMFDIANNHRCVIYGWTPRYSTNPNYYTKSKQPVYKVLMEDGSHRKISQDMLVPTPKVGSLNSNKDLGRYFSHFFKNHFVPNAEQEKEYPYDKKIRHKFYHRMVQNHYKP